MDPQVKIPRMLALVGMIVGASAVTASATFEGKHMRVDWLYPDPGSIYQPHWVTVGAHVELPPEVFDLPSYCAFMIDIGADDILFTFLARADWLPAEFNGWRFRDAYGLIPDIVDCRIDSMSSGMDGFTNDDLHFDAESIWVNFSGTSINGVEECLRLKVRFVPEPATFSLLAIASVGLSMGRRRRKIRARVCPGR